MGWFKSPEWEQIITKAESWRESAARFVDDPDLYPPPRDFGSLTYDLVHLCDEYATVDTGRLSDFWQQLQVQSGKSVMGRRVDPEELTAMMMRCVGVLDRLWHLGTTNTKPKPKSKADSKPDNEKKSLPDSPDVRDLCRLLQKGLPTGKTKTEIALEFTGGNEKKADSLLRQTRRFTHLY